MKIIITVGTYYPHKDGVQAVTQYHAEGLVAKGHDVTVVTKEVDNYPDLDMYNGVKIIRTNISNKCTLHFGDKKGYQKLILDLTKDADVLVAVCLQSVVTDWLLGVLDNIPCAKFLYMHGMHDFKWHKCDFISLINFSKKILRDIRWGTFYPISYNNIRKFDMVSHLHRCDNAYLYFEKHKLGNCTVLQNAADEVFFLDVLQRVEGLPEKYLISVSNYDSRKNQAMTMEAFYQAETVDCGLIFIGSKKNKYYEHLVSLKKRLEKTYGEKDVRLLVDIPRDKVCYYIKNALSFLMSSTWEAFPISIIEAMAGGVPFLSTNVGIVRFLPGGQLVANIQEMREWIECYIKNPKTAESVGKSGKIYAEEHLNHKVQVDRFEEILFKIYKQ